MRFLALANLFKIFHIGAGLPPYSSTAAITAGARTFLTPLNGAVLGGRLAKNLPDL